MGWQGDDASAGVVTVTKEVAVRIYSVPASMQAIGLGYGCKNPIPILVDYTFNC
jgi:hypothetical protein